MTVDIDKYRRKSDVLQNLVHGIHALIPAVGYTARVALLSEIAVSLQELESAVSQLPADQLTAFARWFDEYMAAVWDRRIEEDIKAGRLDEAGRRADADFEAGRCKPL